ncbi:hypothetical protein GQ44DRAFT_719166 [Phaeosphaeriaceae sp. PMI808]|nr:hypothetical protein GQ44DRAFT_719166 [Phaeosphaeriaceae sp. PMI808]
MAASKSTKLVSTIQRKSPTGISALVVGSGMAGLTFAIEAYRQGHDVRIIEKRPRLEDFGEVISIQTPVVHNLKKWPGIMEQLSEHAISPPEIHMFKYDGTALGKFPLGTPEVPSLVLNRLKLHAQLEEYARSLGIETEYATNAIEYTETNDGGGVILSDGRKLTADVVVAADGVGSKSWKLILGKFNEPVSLGYAIYRANFPSAPALKNPIIAKHFEGAKTRMELHFGPNAHSVIAKWEDHICWDLTHRDDGNAKEDWWWVSSKDNALPYVETWSSFLSEIINSTPGQTCIEWKLMWRDPQAKWTSPKGRVIQIGDAAHAFLPSSASGGSMAMEDAFSLAACLQISGKQDISLATQVHNKLRFERVSCAQKMGFKNHEKYHKTNWDVVEQNPEIIRKSTGQWLLHHDPVQYAYDNFQACAAHLLGGTLFKNSNFVPGHTFKEWTAAELLEAPENGKAVVDDGDWS